ncbi:MAG TPA: hypothetical protein VNV63_04320 [Nitrospiria bacterium]|jgi:hypothetical protein|nr:hypothetical protein [Nitrospiria bacterium]
MDILEKYSLADWVYGVVTSLIAAAFFTAIVFTLRWFWGWIRNSSAEYRRTDQRNRIIKIFIYRRYIGAANVFSLSRGHFFVISHCLQSFIAGVAIIAMGAILSWVMNMPIAFYMFLGLAIWMFIDATTWLDTRWSEKALEQLDEQALSEASAILGEPVDEVRNQVTQPNVLTTHSAGHT